MSWATPEETLTWTGATVTPPELEMAQAIVEEFAGTTEEASDAGRISSANLRRLKKAVAFQAAYMQQHPDVFSAMDIKAMAEGSGSGMRIDLASETAVFLAPMVRQILRRLSWFAARSIRVRPPNRTARARIEQRYLPPGFTTDDSGCWEEL